MSKFAMVHMRSPKSAGKGAKGIAMIVTSKGKDTLHANDCCNSTSRERT